MKTKLIALSLLLFATSVAHAQNGIREKPVSPVALSKVVKIVLRAEFKPSDEPRVIYLSERLIKKSWLPDIHNVEFVLLTDAEFEKRGQAYLFRGIGWEKPFLRVDFGFGEIDCSAKGRSYFFWVVSKRVHRENQNGGWGADCDAGIEFSDHAKKKQ